MEFDFSQLWVLLPTVQWFVASHRGKRWPSGRSMCTPCGGRRGLGRFMCRLDNMASFCYRGHWRRTDRWRVGGPNVLRFH